MFKEKVVEYKGFTVRQNKGEMRATVYNEKGKALAHFTCSKQCNDVELQDLVEIYLKLKEQRDFGK